MTVGTVRVRQAAHNFAHHSKLGDMSPSVLQNTLAPVDIEFPVAQIGDFIRPLNLNCLMTIEQSY